MQNAQLHIGQGGIHNYIDKQGGGRGLPKCQRYYISLFSKLVNKGGGVKILKILST